MNANLRSVNGSLDTCSAQKAKEQSIAAFSSVISPDNLPRCARS